MVSIHSLKNHCRSNIFGHVAAFISKVSNAKRISCRPSMYNQIKVMLSASLLPSLLCCIVREIFTQDFSRSNIFITASRLFPLKRFKGFPPPHTPTTHTHTHIYISSSSQRTFDFPLRATHTGTSQDPKYIGLLLGYPSHQEFHQV